MKKSIFLLIILVSCSTIHAQLAQVGHITTSYVDSSRNNRNIPVEIYYPADSTGDNLPLTAMNTSRFPVISFGHGFVMVWSAYANVWEAVVPNGYILIFPKTETGLSPSHSTFAEDLAFCIGQMTIAGNDPASPFYQRVDTMNAVMGHSMGGGAAFLAAGLHPSIKALATLAAAETNPSAIAAATSITAPALVIAGENDCVTPPVSNQLPMYNNLSSACKYYVSILGGSHCQMANTNSLCSFGEATCSPSPTVSRTFQHQVIFRYLLPWLDYSLKNNCAAKTTIDSLIPLDTDISGQQVCQPCTPTGIFAATNLDFSIYPNPAKNEVTIELLPTKSTPSELSIADIRGKIILQVMLTEKTTFIPITDLDEGCYIFSIRNNHAAIHQRMIKL